MPISPKDGRMRPSACGFLLIEDTLMLVGKLLTPSRGETESAKLDWPIPGVDPLPFKTAHARAEDEEEDDLDDDEDDDEDDDFDDDDDDFDDDEDFDDEDFDDDFDDDLDDDDLDDDLEEDDAAVEEDI
jgi:hypothetical protein